MKHTVNVDTKPLVDVVKTLSSIPNRKGIECSEFVQLSVKKGVLQFRLAAELIGFGEVKSAEATDMKTPFHLDRGPLFPFLLGFESSGPDKLTLEFEAGKIRFKGGNRTATFNVNDIKTAYPDHVLRDERKVEFSESQRAALGILKSYVCEDALSPELTAIFLSQKKRCMVASNRLAIAAFWTDEPLPFAGPYPAGLVAHHDAAKGIFRSTKEVSGVRVVLGRANLTQTLRSEAASFPLLKAVGALETRGKRVKLQMEAGALSDVVGRLKACSGDSLDQLGLTLNAKAGGRVELVTKTVSAVLRESIKAKVTEDCSAEMLWSTLHPLVNALPGDATLNFTWDAGPYHVWAKDSVHILATKKTDK